MYQLLLIFIILLLTEPRTNHAGFVSDSVGFDSVVHTGETPSNAFSSGFNQRLKFTENKGQITDYAGKLRPDILFAAKGNGIKLYLTKRGIIYVWQQDILTPSNTDTLIVPDLQHIKSTTYQMTMQLVGANTEAKIQKQEQTIDTENYYTSQSAEKGITQITSYYKIVYEEIYPSIDFILYSNEQGLKYDFLIKPGGKVADIKIQYSGNQSIKKLEDGSLHITNPLGVLNERAPVSYVLHNTHQEVIPSGYKLDEGMITFDVNPYKNTDTLVIDPAIAWATYYGGANDEFVSVAIATDAVGSIYLAGHTSSMSGIASNGFQNSLNGTLDAFLVKFNSLGERQWATYYGGAGDENGRAVVVDPAGNIYLSGHTNSASGIASGGYQNTLVGGRDAFLVKFNSLGERQWATYYGGENIESGNGCATDAAGNVYLLGETNSINGIAFNGHQNTSGGPDGSDSFLVKFNAAGERQWATYYGGNKRDFPDNVTVDANNNVYFSGFTASTNNIAFNGHQNSFGEGIDEAFLVKFNAAGERQWATYYGGTGSEFGVAPAVDMNGNVYLAGQTSSAANMADNGHQNVYGGGEDGFLVKFNAAGERQWATYYGGDKKDKINAVRVNQAGDIYVAGRTESTNNISYQGNQSVFGGVQDAFLAKFNQTGERQWATYYGGANADDAQALTIDVRGNTYISGETSSPTGIAFNGMQNTLAGGKDLFLLKLDNLPPEVISLSPANNATDVEVEDEFTLVMTFNEPVQAGKTGQEKITIFENNKVFDAINVKSNFVKIDGPTVTITLKKAPAPGAKIYITMPNGAILDMDGNAYAGIDDATTWNFTTADETEPTIKTLSPLDNAVDVAVGANLELIFSEPIVKGTGNIVVNIGTTSQTIDVTSAAVTIVGDKVTINLPADFPSGAVVNVQIPAGVFKDEAGNNFAGITNATTWNFTVKDITAPTITALSPMDNAVEVEVNANLEITFNEEVKKGTGNIVINNGSTSETIDVTTAAVTISGNKVTINPSADFPSGAAINVQIAAGAFTDLTGNPYVGISNTTAWNFTVEDIIAPTITALSPLDNAIDIAIDANLELIFSEPIVKGTGNITINIGTTPQTIDVTSAAVSIIGNKVTINPPADFPSSAVVNVQMPAGVFKDAAGNNFAGITNATSWNFTVKDVDAPVITLLSPLDNAVDVAINTNLELTFSEPIAKGTGNITINQGTTTQVIDVTSAAVTIAGNKVTINPPADLPAGAQISIQIANTAFKDVANNAFAGITDATSWNFSTIAPIDNTPPTISQLSPTDEATNVETNTNLEITFSEPIVKGTGIITINQGAATQTIDVTSTAVTIAGNKVTINPPADFPSGAAVSVQMPAGVFKDVAGNNFAGITDATIWNFAVSDITPPVITQLSPLDNAVDVATDTKLVITFNEPVKGGDGKVTIFQNGNVLEEILGTSNIISIKDNVVTIDPIKVFAFAANIHIQIATNTFTDIIGNIFLGFTDATTWNFTTAKQADEVPPIITTLSPLDNAIDIAVDANLELTFSEEIQKGSGNITITQGTTTQVIDVMSAAVTVVGDKVTINPPANFASSAAINVQMPAGAFKDIENNNFAGITDATTWNFTVEDITPPTIIALFPLDNAVDVSVETNLEITFSEAVIKGTGNITINQGTTTQTIDVNSTAVSITGDKVTINPTANMPAGTAVYIQIPAGAFTDLANNTFAGITDATSWNFTTAVEEDNTPPTVTVFSPTNGATNVDIETNLELTFSEPVVKGTGNITINHGATSQTVNVNSAAVIIAGNKVTINPPVDFPLSSMVSIELPAGIFKDVAENATEAISWSFTTASPGDIAPPTITEFSPADNATGVAVNTDLVITFNEPVVKGTGSITITHGTSTQTINIDDQTVSVDGAIVRINAPADFPAGSNVDVQMPAGIFKDLQGNNFSGITDATTWNFTVAIPADNTSPNAISFSPPDNATDVAVNTDLVITFSEEVKKGTGNIIINQGTTTQTIDVNSEFVTISGPTVTINPPTDFPSGAAVSILMLSGVFTDLANNSFTGITDASTWNFTVPDNVAPAITSFYPLDNSTDVPANINLIMIFNENIKKGTGNIIITREGTTQTQVIDVNSAAVTVSGTTVIINPPTDFPQGVNIHIQMAGGVFADLAGNPYIGISDPTTWNLTISGFADNTAPVVTTLLPGDDAKDVAASASLVMTFNEPVQKGTGNIVINQGATSQTIDVASEAVTVSGTTVTINPPADFPEGAEINIQMPATVFSDISNNAFAGISEATTWNFTVASPTPSDKTAPVISEFSPADNASAVSVNTNLIITFNEAVKKGTGVITINQSGTSQIIDIESSAVSVDGAIVTINPPADLPANAPVSIQISEGAFADISNNTFGGISDATTWNFTTTTPEDNVSPTISQLTPADDAVDVASSVNLEITFSEPVVKGAGNIVINQGTTTQTIDVNSTAVSITGDKVTINPPADFPAGVVNIQMPAGIFKDVTGNNFAGITNATTWNFTTTAPVVDNIPPTITALSPVDEATNVLIEANLEITFSEPIVRGAGNIVINQGTTTQTIDVNSAAVSIAADKVTINPPADLSAGVAANVQMPAGVFKDVAGNNFAGILDATSWNFTTAAEEDNIPPTVTALLPLDNAVDVEINSNLEITFSEAVKKGTGNIIINQGTTTQTIDVTSAAVSIAGNKATINPPADFPTGAVIDIRISAGVFTDLAGNVYDGIDATEWSFTVVAPVDNTPPVITLLSPANNSVNVVTGTNLEITFSEEVKKGAGNVIIRNESTVLETIDVNNAIVTVSGNKVTINPSADWPAVAVINVQIATGAFTDIANNAFAGITDATTWRFTTVGAADNIAPKLTNLSPANGAVNVNPDANLVITFDEDIKKRSGNITITQNGTEQVIPVTDPSISVTGNTVTINPATNFGDGAVVTVQMPAGVFTDLAGNYYAGMSASQWSFTVIAPVDVTAPVVAAFSPLDNATGVAVNSNLVITFNEPVQKGAGSIQISQNGTNIIIPVADAAITVSGNTVTINPVAIFSPGAQINVQMPGGVFKDIAGNNYAGITDATTWNFTIGLIPDNTAPNAVSFTPADDATNVARNTDLVITFNEPVQKGTGSITITQNGTEQIIAVASPAVTISGNTATINPAVDFKAGSQIHVMMPPGVFTDLANNAYAGINQPTTWNFTTAGILDEVAPDIVSFSPADNAVNVAVNSNLVITFNEDIKTGTGNIIINFENTTRTIDIISPEVTIAGKILTINPATDFPSGSAVHVLILPGTVTDLADNPFGGIISADTWNFSVIDNIPPTVSSFFPADNATNVARNTDLIITFSEAIKKGTGNIQISQNGEIENIPVTDPRITVSGSTATITPTIDFKSGAQVYILAPSGIFTDLADNAYTGINEPATWNFTIAGSSDELAPEVISLSPPDNSTNVAVEANLVVTFNEDIKAGAGNIIIAKGGTAQTIDVTSSAVTIAGKTLTISPEVDFPSGEAVSVLILPGAVTDIAGNAFKGITDASTWNFTIIDNIPPVISSFFPADNATSIAANINLVMIFSEAVKKGTGTITITQGESTQTIDLSSEAVIIDGNTVIINPPLDFPFDANISIQMPAGIFTDMAGNNFAGITDESTWSLTVSKFADTSPPIAVSFSPADNSTNVQANTNLEITFSENVQKGAGTITITQGANFQTIDISDASVSVSGSTVIINPGNDFQLGSEVHVLIPAGGFTDMANNIYAGITQATGWNFTVDADIPVTIINHSFPEVILSNAATTEATIEVNRMPADAKVEFVSKGIARTNWSKQVLTSNSLTFKAAMAQTQFDEIGLEYFFDITLASGIKVVSDTGYTYIQYVGDGLDIPELKFGATVEAYQIISIPLELKNKAGNAVIEDNLGEYNIKQWRFFHYRNDILQEYNNGFNNVESGQGYWLIVRNPANINTGEGTTVKVKRSNPYTIQLKKGWNQIGNPYNFNVSWSDVKSFNNNPEGLGSLRLFENEFLDSDLLKKFRGAFVFAERDMAINIPVLKNETANRRIRAVEENKFNPGSLWEVSFALRSKEMGYRLAGLGMHPEAKPSKDRFDDITVPRFIKYLELNFKHPEYFAPDFTKDIRPVEENQIWEFTVESNLEPQSLELQWNNYFSEKFNPGFQLILFDITHNKIVDVRRQNGYVFGQDSLTNFKLYYGSPEFINEHLQSLRTELAENFPNPFREETTIRFILSQASDEYEVKLQVYSTSGQLINTLAEGIFSSGAHQVVWNGRDATGKKMPAGLYIYKLEVVSEGERKSFVRKMLLQ